MPRVPALVIAIAAAMACSHPSSEVAPSPQPASTAGSRHEVGTVTETVKIAAPRSGIAQFMPAFPAVDSGGVCGYLPPEARTPEEWVAFMTFPSDSNPVRRVTVRYDSTGVLTDYSDLRGDMTPPRVVRETDGSTHLVFPTGRRTEIILSVSKGFGLARNVGGDEPEESFDVSGSTMLDAENLGHPAQMAERILKECR